MSYPPEVIAAARQIILDRLADLTPVQGPHPAYCTCGAPRWAHEGKTFNGRCEATGCKRYRADIRHELADRAIAADGQRVTRTMREYEKAMRAKVRKARGPREPGQWGVSASDVTNCRRRIWYRETPPADFVRDPEDKREALIGSAIHEAAQRADAWAHPWREHEGNVQIPGLDANARFDVYDPLTATVIDYKSAGKWRWDTLADGPDERAWWQLALYGLALNRAGRPVTRLRMIYIRRENGHEEAFDRPYDEAEAIAALDFLLQIVTMLDLGEELPRDRTGPDLDPLCRRCFARTHCWDLPAAKANGRSAASWIFLGPTPAEKDVERVLIDYDRARTEETAAGKAKEFAKSQLDGIPYGTYGSMVYGETPNWRESTKDYIQALEAAFDLPELMRPPLEELKPKRVNNPSISIKPVRAATRQTRAKKAAADAAAQNTQPSAESDGAAPKGDAA